MSRSKILCDRIFGICGQALSRDVYLGSELGVDNVVLSERALILLDGLNMLAAGLEVSPLYRPIALRCLHQVYYTDYTSSEESRKKHLGYEHDEIVEIDFIWEPHKSLIECVPVGLQFDWAIASHVLEHVPNPLGWILQIFEVLSDGGILSLALPKKDSCFDIYRRDTEAADVIDAWIRNQSIPSPRQLYDFLTMTVDFTGSNVDYQSSSRHYTDQDALNFVIHSWTEGAYIDAHCSVFTAESFVSLFRNLIDLGLINAEITDPVDGPGEFYVKLIKRGPARVQRPMAFDPVPARERARRAGRSKWWHSWSRARKRKADSSF